MLAGPDWKEGKAKLEQLANRFGCRDRIHLPGPLYGEKKWSLLRMADVFVSPSRWEAFSIAQAEAMAVGLPVVTSTGVNLAPDLREADAALLVPLAVEPLAKAIATLEADPERRRALGNRGKAWMERNCDPDRAGASVPGVLSSHSGKGAGARLEPFALKVMFSSKSPFLPDPHLLAELIQRKRYARIARRAEQGMVRQWFLLYGQASKEWLLNPQPARLRKLLPPDDRSWADPFLWKRGDDWFIFCEEWLTSKPYGHISVMQVSRDGQVVSPAKPVLMKAASSLLSLPL